MFRHHFFHFVIVREKYLNPDSICHICPPDQTICFRKQPPGVQSKNTGSRIDPANHSSQHLVFNPQTRRQSNMSLVFFQKIIQYLFRLLAFQLLIQPYYILFHHIPIDFYFPPQLQALSL